MPPWYDTTMARPRERRRDAAEVREDSVWKAAYVNELPDSAFLYIEAGGKKDGDEKTTPRSLRHFPYRDDSGKVDVLHLRSAISEAPKATTVAEAVRRRVEERARRLLAEQEGGRRSDEVRLDAGALKRTPQGGLAGPAAVSRVGVFRYVTANGPRMEYRPAEEVFHADSLASLENAPITIGHPKTSDGMVDVDTYAEFAKGHVREPRADTGHVLAQAIVQDGDAVRDILSGKLGAISPGYDVDWDPTPGVYQGQRYDGVQRNIRYNHIALLRKGGGRQGDTVALRFDACQDNEDDMATFRFDNKDYDLPAQAQQLDAAIKAWSDATVAAATAPLTKTVSETQAKLDASTTELGPLKAEKATAARAALEGRARKIMGEAGAEAKFDGKTDREVMESALATRKVDVKGKDAVYVTVRFDALEDILSELDPKAKDPVLEAVAAATNPGGVGFNENTYAPNAWGNAHKQPLNATKRSR